MISWTTFQLHSLSYNEAFEALCIQLFERWTKREFAGRVKYFTAVNSAGGDGGVEAYTELNDSTFVGLQAKWFPDRLEGNQFRQIESSIISAKTVRGSLTQYIVCIPRLLQNKKIGRGNRITKTNEFDDVEELKKNIRVLFSDLEVIFWTEKNILDELQQSGNDGIRRYWFEKEEISFDRIFQAYKRAEKGWLHDRYFHDLHHQGTIEEEISEVILSPGFRLRKARVLEDLLKPVDECRKVIERFIKDQVNPTFDASLLKISSDLEELNGILNNIRTSILLGDPITDSRTIPEPHLDDLILNLGRSIPAKNKDQVQKELLHQLGIIAYVDVHNYIAQLIKDLQPHNAIILGKPASGKTDALASAVDKNLGKQMPALIIQARSTPCDSWADIMQHSLDSLNWTGDEIFSALEALAISTDVRILRASATGILEITPRTNFLICVDGVEENFLRRTAWKDRINELREIVRQYPRLRFVVSCRWFPTNLNPLNLTFDSTNRNLVLPGNDVDIRQYLPDYFKKYDIDVGGFPEIISAIKDGLMLRLFCEQYERVKDFSNVKVTPTLLSLITAKIERMETEFYLKFSPSWQREGLMRSFLAATAEIFSQDVVIAEEDLITQLIANVQIKDKIPSSSFMQLIDFFVSHGFISQDEEESTSTLAPPTKVFSVTHQSYMEYALSIIAVDRVVKHNELSFPQYLNGYWNAQEYAAIALASDYRRIVGENGLWCDMPSENLSSLMVVAIEKSPKGNLQHYAEWLISSFKSAPKYRYQIIDRFVLPNCRDTSYPVNVRFVHEILSKCSTTFERDMIWSGPEYLTGDDQFYRVSNQLKNEHLQLTDDWDGLPLLFAWSLTTVDNEYREYVRKELTQWGRNNFQGFLQLLKNLFRQGDAQMQEDLSQIAVGISCFCDESDKEFTSIASWFLEEVFAPEKINLNKNSVVRHCGRIVCERAVDLGMIADEDAKYSRPPYSVTFELLPLDDIAFTDFHEEIYPIVHDLAWYVIDDAIRGFLDYGYDDKAPEPKKFIFKYNEQYGEDKVHPKNWLMGTAIHYIRSLGFDRHDESGNSFTGATHGSLSKVATFEEKYTWLSVHYLQGYLADCLPLRQGRHGIDKTASDYSWIISISNPAQFLFGYYQIPKPQWLIQTSQSPNISNSDPVTQEVIKGWVDIGWEPDFSKLLFYTKEELQKVIDVPSKDWCALSYQIRIAQNNKMMQTFIEATACYVEEKDFSFFVENIEDSYEFDEPSNFQASPDNGVVTYINPKIVIQHNWVTELYSKVEFKRKNSGCKVYRAIARCTDNTMKDGEKEYIFPSKMLREILGITDGDGYSFYDNGRQLIAFTNEVQDSSYDYHEILFADREKLDSNLKKHGFKILWLVRELRMPSTEASQKFQGISGRRIQKWLVWMEGEEVKFKSYFDSNED